MLWVITIYSWPISHCITLCFAYNQSSHFVLFALHYHLGFTFVLIWISLCLQNQLAHLIMTRWWSLMYCSYLCCCHLYLAHCFHQSTNHYSLIFCNIKINWFTITLNSRPRTGREEHLHAQSLPRPTISSQVWIKWTANGTG